MAAPTVRGRTAPVAGLAATSPAGTAVGDMVIVFTWETRANVTPPAHTLQSTFVEFGQQTYTETGQSGRLSVAYKLATSAGANSYQAYTSNVGTTVRTGIIVLTVATFNVGTKVFAGASTTNNSAPDSPNATLGATRDWLVVTLGGWCFSASTANTAGVPTNYSNLQQYSTAGLAAVASAERALTAPASENPATFTDNTTPTGTASVTIAVASIIETTRTVAVSAIVAVTAANREFFTTFARAVALDAGVGIATNAIFWTTFERQSAIDAALGVASAATFFTVLERQAAIDAAFFIASSGEVEAGVIVHQRSAALDALVGIASSGIFWTTFERQVMLDPLVGVASIPQRELFRRAGLDAAVVLDAVPQRELFRQSAIDAAFSLETLAMRELLRAADFDAAIDVSSDGHGLLECAVLIDAAVLFTSQGFRIGEEFERTASLAAAVVLEAQAQHIGVRERSAAIDVLLGVASVPQKELIRAAALDVLAEITSSGFGMSGNAGIPPRGGPNRVDTQGPNSAGRQGPTSVSGVKRTRTDAEVA